MFSHTIHVKHNMCYSYISQRNVVHIKRQGVVKKFAFDVVGLIALFYQSSPSIVTTHLAVSQVCTLRSMNTGSTVCALCLTMYSSLNCFCHKLQPFEFEWWENVCSCYLPGTLVTTSNITVDAKHSTIK